MTGDELIKLIEKLDEVQKGIVLKHVYKYFNKNMPKSSIVIVDKSSDLWCGEDDFWNNKNLKSKS